MSDATPPSPGAPDGNEARRATPPPLPPGTASAGGVVLPPPLPPATEGSDARALPPPLRDDRAAPESVPIPVRAAEVVPAAASGALGLQSVLEQAFAAPPRGEPAPRSTPHEACILPVLQMFGWAGTDRRLLEAKPHLEPIGSTGDFLAVLHRLGFKGRRARLSTDRLGNDHVPVLLDRRSGPAVVIAVETDGDLLVFDGATGEAHHEAPSRRAETVYLLAPSDETEVKPNPRHSWFFTALRHFYRPIAAVTAITFLTNLLALATPIYIASVYNHVIAAHAFDSLAFFAAGIVFLILVELHLRHLKAGLVAYVGARFHAALANAAFERVLLLPITMIEQASVSAQIGRFRQFEGIRTFFTGHLVNALLDLPFTLLFFAALWTIGGLFVLIPIGLVVVFAALGALSIPVTRRNVARTGAALSKSQGFLVESLGRAETIRQLGAEQLWIERYKTVSRDAVLARFHTQVFDSGIQSAAQTLSTLAGVASLAVGAVEVIGGSLSVGGLIAVMMLIWRLLAPVQTAFLAINNIGQVIESVRQVNLLMKLQPERQPTRMPTVTRAFTGRVTLDGVALRHAGRPEPALRGVSLDIPPGQMIAITGPAGAGKTSLLKLILGFYQPLTGTVFIDGLNLQQLDPGEVRVALGYVPQDPAFFFGTIAQNLRMADPGASDERLAAALARAGLADLAARMPEGLETKMRSGRLQAFGEGTLMSLALARAYLKEPAIYLIDDPGAWLDRQADEAFISELKRLKGKATVILVTNRPSHMRVCDRVVRIARGQVVADGAPDELLGQKPPLPQQDVYPRTAS